MLLSLAEENTITITKVHDLKSQGVADFTRTVGSQHGKEFANGRKVAEQSIATSQLLELGIQCSKVSDMNTLVDSL